MDFKEQAIYEFEKDKAFSGANEFRTRIKEKYGFVPNSNLYRRIINYQIKKYGEPLANSKQQDFVLKHNIVRNAKKRRQEKEYSKEWDRSRRIVERLQNEKN